MNVTRSSEHRRRTGHLSRRAVLRGAAMGAVGAAGAALVGCDGDDNGDGTAPASVTPADTLSTPHPDRVIDPDGRFVDSGLGAIAGADPHRSVYHGSSLVRQVYLCLLRTEMLRPDIGIHHELASSHEVLDDITCVFTLRPDATIHPNVVQIPERAMDTEDVLASFDRISDPDSGANGLPFFARWVDHYEAPDEHTVRLTLRGPYAWMLAAIGNSMDSLIAPREMLDLGPSIFGGAAVGAGPFILESMEEGIGYFLRRNPAFYNHGIPRVQTLGRRLYPHLGAYDGALRSREVDYWLSADARSAENLMSELDGVALNVHGSLEFNSFWMRADTAPWSDARVRRAVNRAMNRAEYIDHIGGGAGEPMGPLAPAFGEYAIPAAELQELQPHDPEEARQLFEAAGVSEISFVYPVSGDTGVYVDILTRQLAEVGVRVHARPLEAATWLYGYVRAAHTASLSLNQSYKTPDAALLWHRSGGPAGSGVYETGHSTEELDRLIDAAATTLDEAERIEIYREAQRAILASDPAFLNIFNLAQHAVHYDDVHGLDPGPGHMGEFLYRQVWVEQPDGEGS